MVQGKQSQDKFLCAGMVYDLTRRSELATIKQEEVADVFAFVGKSHVKSEM